MKVSTFVVGLMTVGMVAGLGVLWLTSVTSGSGAAIQSSDFQDFNQSAALLAQTADINDTLQQLSASSTATDFASAFIASGWKVLKTTLASINIAVTMATSAFDNLKLPGGVGAWVLMILITVFCFAVVSAVLGRDV